MKDEFPPKYTYLCKECKGTGWKTFGECYFPLDNCEKCNGKGYLDWIEYLKLEKK